MKCNYDKETKYAQVSGKIVTRISSVFMSVRALALGASAGQRPVTDWRKPRLARIMYCRPCSPLLSVEAISLPRRSNIKWMPVSWSEGGVCVARCPELNMPKLGSVPPPGSPRTKFAVVTSLSIPTTFKRPRQSDARGKRTWSTNGVSLQEKAASIRSMVVRLFAATGFANGFAAVVNCANEKLRGKTRV